MSRSVSSEVLQIADNDANVQETDIASSEETGQAVEIKSFLSRQKEVYKIPYETHPEDRLRQCVFGGTSNAPVSYTHLYSGDLIYKGSLDAFYPTTDPQLFYQSIRRPFMYYTVVGGCQEGGSLALGVELHKVFQ